MPVWARSYFLRAELLFLVSLTFLGSYVFAKTTVNTLFIERIDPSNEMGNHPALGFSTSIVNNHADFIDFTFNPFYFGFNVSYDAEVSTF